MQELNVKDVLQVSGGSVGDYWGVGNGTQVASESRLLTSCERGVIGGAIAGAVGGLKGLLAGIIGGAIAGGCGSN